MVRLLLERGFDPNTNSDEGLRDSPVPRRLSVEILWSSRRLLEYGADVHLREGFWGWTPLHVAVSGNDQWLRQRDRTGGGSATVGPRGGHSFPG